MKKTSFLFIFATFIFIGLSIWWNSGISPVNKRDTTQKIFVVQKGDGIRAVANNLKKENLIRDPILFFVLVKKLGLEGKIQAGDFRLSPSQSTEEIAKNLTHGTLDIWITIPEGVRGGEIADILKKGNPGFLDSWKITLVQNEGYLFPDTYLLPRDAGINIITSIVKNNFENKISQILIPKEFTQKDIVTIASLIEREAKFKDDRPLVSSVIHNRLKLGMPLQIDATVQYVLGYQPLEQRWWKKNLTTEDLKINSPFNTYIHPGLPPTPISNPGISALQAAANPSSTEYLYYISDKNGRNHYAKTLDEHSDNIRKYGL